MCSDEPESSRTWAAPAVSRFTRPAPAPVVRPVWVLLEEVCRHDPALSRSVGSGLDFTGRVEGLLTGWRRTARGEWLGVVNYAVRYADGRPDPVWWRDQMVPAYALRPRGEPPPGPAPPVR